MTIDVTPTTKKPTHHVSLSDGSTEYGLVLYPNSRAIQRRPRLNSRFETFTQSDWSGGRGIRDASSDRSRFSDSKRLNSRRSGRLMLGGMETYTTGHRQLEQHMPADASGLTWQPLTGSNRFVAFQVTASET